MSKLDGLRAMREAKYAASRPAGPAASTAPPQRAAARPVPPPGPAPVEPVEASPAMCGHRSMNGRTCTREHGHASKSHRYS